MEVLALVVKSCLFWLFIAGLSVLGQGVSPQTEEADIFLGAPINTIFTGHVYRQILGGSRIYCGALCTRNASGCHSFNYCRNTKLCELNSSKLKKYPQDLMAAELEGCSYYDIAVECEMDTEGYVYHYLPFVVDVTRIEFRVRASSDAVIGLSWRSADDSSMYQIFIGAHDNTWADIRRGIQYNEKTRYTQNDLVTASQFRGFWITYDFATGRLAVGKEGQQAPFMEWTDPSPIDVKYIGFSSWNGVTGTFRYLCSI